MRCLACIKRTRRRRKIFKYSIVAVGGYALLRVLEAVLKQQD